MGQSASPLLPALSQAAHIQRSAAAHLLPSSSLQRRGWAAGDSAAQGPAHSPGQSAACLQAAFSSLALFFLSYSTGQERMKNAAATQTLRENKLKDFSQAKASAVRGVLQAGCTLWDLPALIFKKQIFQPLHGRSSRGPNNIIKSSHQLFAPLSALNPGNIFPSY